MTTYANPSGLSEKKRLLCRKARYVRSLGKKPNFWPSQRLNKLTGALSCMHKGPKCIQSLCDHPKKIPFVQKHKEGAICAILREKTPFLAFPEAKEGVVNCARLHKAAHWPNNNANPSGLSEKKVYCVQSLPFCRQGGNFSFERGGVGPSKKCWFWCNGPSTKAPQIPLRHQKTFHLALFLSNLAILKSSALFQGLN